MAVLNRDLLKYIYYKRDKRMFVLIRLSGLAHIVVGLAICVCGGGGGGRAINHFFFFYFFIYMLF